MTAPHATQYLETQHLPKTPSMPLDSTSSFQYVDCPTDELSQLEYVPLTGESKFRLLKLHQAKTHNATVHGTLTTTDLHAEPSCRTKFTAISYEWGPDGGSSNPVIIINGQKLSVRRNLHTFLLRYRQALGASVDRHKGRWYQYTYQASSYDVEYIWVDQICIDQTSTSERNQQVQLMSTIYSKAEYIIAWLGESAVVERYLEYAIQLASSVPAQRLKSWMKNAQLRLAAESFVKLSYWQRLWIHQEVLLGKAGLMLMAGQSIVSRYQLTNLHINHRTREELFEDQPWPPIINDVLFPDTESYNWNGHLHLYYTVCTFSSNHCQDPRDRVFGLQGLISNDERIEVNYSLSPQEIFQLAIQGILKAGIFDIGEKHIDMDGPSRASSRLEFLQQAEEMRRRLEKLAGYMGVDLVGSQVEEMILMDFERIRRATRLAEVPEGSTLRREIARERWGVVRIAMATGRLRCPIY